MKRPYLLTVVLALSSIWALISVIRAVRLWSRGQQQPAQQFSALPGAILTSALYSMQHSTLPSAASDRLIPIQVTALNLERCGWIQMEIRSRYYVAQTPLISAWQPVHVTLASMHYWHSN